MGRGIEQHTSVGFAGPEQLSSGAGCRLGSGR